MMRITSLDGKDVIIPSHFCSEMWCFYSYSFKSVLLDRGVSIKIDVDESCLVSGGSKNLLNADFDSSIYVSRTGSKLGRLGRE